MVLAQIGNNALGNQELKKEMLSDISSDKMQFIKQAFAKMTLSESDDQSDLMITKFISDIGKSLDNTDVKEQSEDNDELFTSDEIILNKKVLHTLQTLRSENDCDEKKNLIKKYLNNIILNELYKHLLLNENIINTEHGGFFSADYDCEIAGTFSEIIENPDKCDRSKEYLFIINETSLAWDDLLHYSNDFCYDSEDESGFCDDSEDESGTTREIWEEKRKLRRENKKIITGNCFGVYNSLDRRDTNYILFNCENKHTSYIPKLISMCKKDIINIFIDTTGATEEEKNDSYKDWDSRIVDLDENYGGAYIRRTTEDESDVIINYNSTIYNLIFCPKYIDRNSIIMTFIVYISFLNTDE